MPAETTKSWQGSGQLRTGAAKTSRLRRPGRYCGAAAIRACSIASGDSFSPAREITSLNLPVSYSRVVITSAEATMQPQ